MMLSDPAATVPMSGATPRVRDALAAPEALLLLAVATAATPLYLNPVGHFTLRSTDVFVALAGLLWGLDALRGRAARLVRTPIDLPLAVLGGAMFVSLFVAKDRVLWLKALRPWVLAGTAYFLLVAHLTDAGKIRRLVAASLLGLAGQALFGGFQLVGGEDGMRALLSSRLGHVLYEPDVIDDLLRDFLFNWAMGPNDPVRGLGLSVYPSGTSINSANFSVLMALTAVLVVAMPSSRSRRGLWAGVAAALVPVGLMFLSFKRSGWVAFVAAFAFVSIARPRSVVRMAVLGVALVGMYGAVRASHPAIGNTFEARAASIQTELKEGEANSRRALWMHAAELVREHPLTGVGLGSWQFYGPWVQTRRGLVRWSNPESSVVGIAAETGVFGFLGFAGVIVTLLFLAWRRARTGWEEPSLALAAGLGVLVIAVGASLNDLFTADAMWPLFAAYAAAIVASERVKAGAESLPAAPDADQGKAP